MSDVRNDAGYKRLVTWVETYPGDAADEITALRALLARVLDANIAKGCPPEHPRVSLIYDIHAAMQE